MKPDWKDAPEWANWLAKDRNGNWYWFDEKPLFHTESGKWGTSDSFSYAGKSAKNANYVNSLEQRPTENKNSGKPDWKDAPEWANWLAQDGDRRWYWYEHQPKFGGTNWVNVLNANLRSRRCATSGTSESNLGWENSLEQRPTEVELEYVDPYDQKLEPGDVTVDVTKAQPFPEISEVDVSLYEVQEGAVMNTPGYEELAGVLVRAYDQAASGKGKERHAGDEIFVNQPMQTISDLLDSDAGMAFQAIKKIKEARGLSSREAQVRELLGAINYIAGMALWLESQPMTNAEVEDDFEGGTCSVSSRRPELLGGIRSSEDDVMIHSSGVKAIIKDGEVRYEYPEKQQ